MGPAPDPGDNLIGNGAEGLAPVLGRGLAAVAGAEEQRFFTGRHRLVAEVDDELVHADRPGDRPPAATGLHQGTSRRGPRHAVGVTERDQAQGGLGRGDVPVAVRHAGAGRHPFHLRQPRFSVIAGRSQPEAPRGSVDRP